MTTRTSRERAEEILEGLVRINQHMGYQFTQPLMNAQDAISAALDEARNQAIEEAAKCVDDHAQGVCEIVNMGDATIQEITPELLRIDRLAKRIRDLRAEENLNE